MLCGINCRFQQVSPSERQIAHVLLTRPPLKSFGAASCGEASSFDLHVLSVPPAFVLSQDQTLNQICISKYLPVLCYPVQSLLTIFFNFSVFSWPSRFLQVSYTLRNFQGFLVFVVIQFSRYLFSLSCDSYSRSPSRVLIYYITPARLCQYLFSKKIFPEAARRVNILIIPQLQNKFYIIFLTNC